jgi:hypothetical protein
MLKWYVYEHKSGGIGTRYYIPRSLQVDVKDVTIRFFHCKEFFFVYVFRGEKLLDLQLTFTKQDALKFIDDKIGSL